MDYSILADYDQYHRTAEQAAYEAAIPAAPEPSPALPPTCGQCVSWRHARTITTELGITAHIPGYCQSRAAADLCQMPQSYAAKCRLYEQEYPF